MALLQALRKQLLQTLERDARRRDDPDNPGETYLFECGGCLVRVISQAGARAVVLGWY